MGFVAAAALTDVRLGIDSFSDAAAARADLATLLPRIHAFEDPTQPGYEFPAEQGHVDVRVSLRDGSLVSTRVAHARGSCERPMTRAEMEAKFRDCTTGLRDPAAAASVIAAVADLAKLAAASSLSAALAA